MTTHSINSSMWFFGIQAEEIRRIRDAAGTGYDCRLLDSIGSDAILSLLEGVESEPLLIWLGTQTWLSLRDENPDLLRHILLAPTVLAIENNASREVLELALAAHVQQVVRVPLIDEQIFDALSRAREARNIYDDMTRMSREIHIGRELMERKSNVCSMLFRFFEHVGAAKSAHDVLRGCAASLSCFPVEGVHGVWWGNGGPAYALVGVDVPGLAESWFAFLVEQTAKLRPVQKQQLPTAPASPKTGERQDSERAEIRCLCAGAPVPAYGSAHSSASSTDGGPNSGHVLLLTLEVGTLVCGVLALHLRESCLCGRDTTLAINAMRRHLALVMWEGAQHEAFFAGAERLALSSVQGSAATRQGKARAM